MHDGFLPISYTEWKMFANGLAFLHICDKNT